MEKKQKGVCFVFFFVPRDGSYQQSESKIHHLQRLASTKIFGSLSKIIIYTKKK